MTHHAQVRFLDPIDRAAAPTVVRVKSGRALIFSHELLHEVNRIESGVRHAIRTDVVYADPLLPTATPDPGSAAIKTRASE